MIKWQSSSSQLDMGRKYGNGLRAQRLRPSLRKPHHRKKIDSAMYDTKAMMTRRQHLHYVSHSVLFVVQLFDLSNLLHACLKNSSTDQLRHGVC